MIMSQRLKRNYHALRLLEGGDAQLRKAVISASSDDLVKSLSELALNTLAGNIELSQWQKRKLAPHRKQVRLLAKKSSSTKTKRNLLKQKGGFIPLLIAPAVSLLASLVGKAL